MTQNTVSQDHSCSDIRLQGASSFTTGTSTVCGGSLDSLECPPGDHLLHIPPGQPFRLHLWHRLATFLGDPDADFLLSLVKGVPLGVNEDLLPSPAWPSHEGVVTDPAPLLDCMDSRKSAQYHPTHTRRAESRIRCPCTRRHCGTKTAV